MIELYRNGMSVCAQKVRFALAENSQFEPPFERQLERTLSLERRVGVPEGLMSQG